ncbi:beta-ketoacyl-[acyl-carrier-protein] synthase family protein [Acidimicrobiia bacterium EGI L10123]|uniref:beta-ketoacyl-[acyl-carrier-protein] synthase family protein n=1 Tax=Salinilacustrithrix flava TaxID=2957203 RepID=UPI003D7C2CB0|nr:beta-ketoacyl-[acyl-carrier-protein] synthase family protein [Acidimicrobiia bacterium EGI L10123]
MTDDRTHRTRRRVAITAVSAVAKAGIGAEQFWDGLCTAPEDGMRRIDDFDPAPYFANPKEARRSDRFAQLALAAAQDLLEQAGHVDGDIGHDPSRMGVSIATGIGGIETLEEQIIVNAEKGSRRVSPFLVPMMMPNSAGASVSMKYGWQGPCESIVTACAAGTHGITRAADLIAWDRCDAVIAGGSESALTPTGLAGFQNMTALSNDGVSRPFSADRNGFVIAEGAGLVLLEEWDAAVARGATILGEFLGGASTADAHHITAPAPGGVGAVTCMELALADAGLRPEDIGHINAHGTSTPLNDAAEAHAIAKVFGDDGPPVTSTKGVTGHALGAAGALEAVAAVMAIQKRLIPPTFGTTAVDPELPQIDLVLGEPREWEPGPVLSNSFGFGGHNGCLIVAPPS